MNEPTPIRATPGQINAVQQIASTINPNVTGTPDQINMTDIVTTKVRDTLTAAAVVLSIVSNKPIGAKEVKELERLAFAAYDLALIEIVTSPDKYEIGLRTLATASYTSTQSRNRVRAGLSEMARSYKGTQPNPEALK